MLIEAAGGLGILVLAFFIFLIIIGIFIKANLVLSSPNEVVVLSGRKHRTLEGETVGYRDLLMFGPIYQAAIKDMTGVDIPNVLHNALGEESGAPAGEATVDQAPQADPTTDNT